MFLAVRANGGDTPVILHCKEHEAHSRRSRGWAWPISTLADYGPSFDSQAGGLVAGVIRQPLDVVGQLFSPGGFRRVPGSEVAPGREFALVLGLAL